MATDCEARVILGELSEGSHHRTSPASGSHDLTAAVNTRRVVGHRGLASNTPASHTAHAISTTCTSRP